MDVARGGLGLSLPAAVHIGEEVFGGPQSTARSVFMGSLAASYPEAREAFDVSTQASDARPAGPPPDVEILSSVRDGDGNYEGYIAVNGACMDALGICVGYLNDVERTAGSPKGEYLGCVTEPCRGEATIERPDGTQLAVLELGRTNLKTITGSTVAEFKMNGEVVANLGHRVCSFDMLSFHDQPTMALYLAFINPGLLTKAALTQASAIRPQRDAISTMAAAPTPTTASNASPACEDAAVPCYMGTLGDIDTPSGASRKCIADFASGELWQLSAKMGDVLVLLETHDDGWVTCINANGRKGMLPLAYLGAPALMPQTMEPGTQAPEPLSAREYFSALMRPLGSDGGIKHSATQSSNSLQLQDFSTPPKHKGSESCFVPLAPRPMSEPTKPKLRGKPKVAIASFDVDMSQEWQISLALDEPCRLLEDHGDGWASILKASGEEGMVPAAYLASLPDDVPVQVPTPPRPRQIRGTYTVLNHFVANDLSWQVDIETDDEVVLCEEFDDGWSSITHVKTGKNGVVPSSFLALK